MPSGSITAGPKSVTQAMGAATMRRDTAATADQPSLPRLYSTTDTALRRSGGSVAYCGGSVAYW